MKVISATKMGNITIKWIEDETSKRVEVQRRGEDAYTVSASFSTAKIMGDYVKTVQTFLESKYP